MSDFNSSLPIRTEQDGDVVIKVADGLVPSQHLTVNSDGSVNITDNGGSITVDGTVELGATSLAALENITVTATDLDIRDLDFATDKVDVSGSDVTATVSATDLDIRDLSSAQDSVEIKTAAGVPLSINADGTLNVVPVEDPGTETVNFNTAAAVAAGATSNHDHTFANASKIYQVFASASGKLKIEVQVETGASTGVFNTILVAFNSTANPNIDATLNKYALVPAGAKVRVIRTNKDTQAQDVYSTIVGILGL